MHDHLKMNIKIQYFANTYVFESSLSSPSNVLSISSPALTLKWLILSQS